MSEEQKTPEDRAKAFLEGYKALVDELQIDLATQPIWVPDGDGGFKTMLQSQPIDITPKAEPSPFVAEDKKKK